jgi:hypothetical protein
VGGTDAAEHGVRYTLGVRPVPYLPVLGVPKISEMAAADAV